MSPPRVKPLLYVYRVLLTGTHLMQSGEVQANLVKLNESAKLPYIGDLIQRKIAGTEKERLTEADLDFHRSEYRHRFTKVADLSRQPAQQHFFREVFMDSDRREQIRVTLRRLAESQAAMNARTGSSKS